MAPPKPDSTQVQHPKRLLMADLQKRGFEAKMQDLIGDVELGDRLRQQGEDDRKERERRGWGAVH